VVCTVIMPYKLRFRLVLAMLLLVRFLGAFLLERQVRQGSCASEASYRLKLLVSMREIRRSFKSKNRAVAVQDGVISMGCASSKRQVPRLVLHG
jgi:hypothetical protein